MRWLAASDIPFARDDANRFLPWIIAFMVCLTGLTLAVILSLQTALLRWGGEYADSFTVQVPASALRDGAVDPERLAALLAENEWAEHVRIVGREEMQRLIAPWLGDAAEMEALPLPLLLEVRMRSQAHVDLASLRKRLQQMAPGAEIDDYRLWMARFQAFSRNIQWFAGIMAALMIGTTLALVVLAAKTALRLHERTVDVLYTIGAEDTYIAGQFQRNAAQIVLRGALAGSLAAALFYALAGSMTVAMQSMLVPPLRMTTAHAVLFLLLPCVTMLAAGGFTRRSVLALLAKRQ